jgi:hypothetical protein
MSIKLITIAALAAASLSASQTFAAPLQNGNFANQLANWNTIGDVSVQTGKVKGHDFGGTPTLVLGTASTSYIDDNAPVAGALNVSGTAPVDAPVLESSLGVPVGSLSQPDQDFSVQEGSAATQSFFVQAGQRVSFDWRLLAQANTAPITLPDTAWLVWTINGQTQTIKLADAAQQNLSPSASGWLDSGLQHASITASVTGTATLGFAVADVNSYDTSTLLAVQNVSAVPEPESLALALAGVLAVGQLVARRTRQN